MKNAILAVAALAVPAWLLAAPKTMRVDCFHTGDSHSELFSLDRIVVEPLEWPGNPDRPIDTTGLGKYSFEVVDAATDRMLYSRGFASIFGEWETTGEAEKLRRTFSESLRFPQPAAAVRVNVNKRDARNEFRRIWSVEIDPKSMFVDTSVPPAPGPTMELQKSGDPAHKVDFLILGDGYAASELPKFERDARRLMQILFETSPYKEHRSDFNVWGLCPPAAESGISRPSTGLHRRNPVGSTYDAFGSERYILTFDNRAFREAAQFAPYDCVEILVNGKTYGGGGIFNLYSTVAADSLWAPYIFVHEFGHHLAGLADEYYTSAVAYESHGPLVEPWEPNVTAETSAEKLKWHDLLSNPVRIPTPWKKDEFETYSYDVQKKRRAIRAANAPESDMDALFVAEREHETRLLGTDASSGRVGLFEGANYSAKGYYRSQEDCIMFTRDSVGFCAACRHAIERVIELDTGKPL